MTSHAAHLVASGRLLDSDVSEDVSAFLNMSGTDAALAEAVLDDFASLATSGGLAEVKSRCGYLVAMLRQRQRKQRRNRRQNGAEEPGERPAKKPKTVKLVGRDHTLFVNHLPWAATKSDIEAHFAPAISTGASISVRMVLKEERFTGTAFVDMDSGAGLEAGLKLHGSEFKCAAGGPSRTINVKPALSKQEISALEDAPSERPARVSADQPAGKHHTFQDDDDDDDGDAAPIADVMAQLRAHAAAMATEDAERGDGEGEGEEEDEEDEEDEPLSDEAFESLCVDSLGLDVSFQAKPNTPAPPCALHPKHEPKPEPKPKPNSKPKPTPSLDRSKRSLSCAPCQPHSQSTRSGNSRLSTRAR